MIKIVGSLKTFNLIPIKDKVYEYVHVDIPTTRFFTSLFFIGYEQSNEDYLLPLNASYSSKTLLYYSRDLFYTSLVKGKIKVFVFCEEDEIKGFIVLEVPKNYISEMGVVTEYKKQKIGSTLLTSIIPLYSNMSLHCFHNLIPFYEKNGFKVSNKYPDRVKMIIS